MNLSFFGFPDMVQKVSHFTPMTSWIRSCGHDYKVLKHYMQLHVTNMYILICEVSESKGSLVMAQPYNEAYINLDVGKK